MPVPTAGSTSTQPAIGDYLTCRDATVPSPRRRTWRTLPRLTEQRYTIQKVIGSNQISVSTSQQLRVPNWCPIGLLRDEPLKTLSREFVTLTGRAVM